jgi:uncharacterized protein (TIGR04255 family)
MPELDPLPNAPISEAMLDIRLGGGVAPSIDDLSRFVERVKAEYPHSKKVGVVHAELRADLGAADAPQLTHSASSEVMGFHCLSEDRKRIAQPRINGFVFSRLRPYDRWVTFKAEARRLFELYCEEFGTRTIERVAIRTINRLDIPGERVDFKEWIRTGPEVSPVLPQGLSGFFMPYDDVKASCIINQMLVPPEVPGTVAVILDIDLFRTASIPQESDAFWALLDQLRDKKDEIFLGCITDRMRETFH